MRPLAGAPRVHVHFDPKPDYARAQIEVVAAGAGLEVVGGPTRLHLATNVPAPYVQDGSHGAHGAHGEYFSKYHCC